MSFILCVSKIVSNGMVSILSIYPQFQREDTGLEFSGLAHRLHLGEK